MLVFRTLPLAAVIGSPWREVAVSAISAGLILFGIGVAINYNGLANRTANVVAGNPDRNPVRPSPRTDRYWGVPPVTLGLTGLFYFLPDVPVCHLHRPGAGRGLLRSHDEARLDLYRTRPAQLGTVVLVHAGGRHSRVSFSRLRLAPFLYRGFRPVRVA